MLLTNTKLQLNSTTNDGIEAERILIREFTHKNNFFIDILEIRYESIAVENREDALLFLLLLMLFLLFLQLLINSELNGIILLMWKIFEVYKGLKGSIKSST